jgi:hypothetical protein
MPDEAIYAERGLTAWRHGLLPLLHGPGAGYGVLYPIVAGLPLSVGSFETGYASLKLLQALVVSLAAVPVFVYGRRLMPPGYAFLAAVLTVASPVLLYSGLVMTEVLFYPLAAFALLAIARAVATAALRDQLIALVVILAAVLTREQAVVFFAVFAAAILLDAAFRRDRSRLRAFWPVWLLAVLAAAIVAAAPGVFGAYSQTLQGGYPVGAGLRLTWDHLAYVVLTTAILPFAALILLTLDAARGRERDADARALLAVTVSCTVLVVFQVGFFASLYAPHLLGRNVAAIEPLLFLVFALWLARGGATRRVQAALAALLTLAVLVVTPWHDLVVPNAFADSFGLAPLFRLHQYAPAHVVLVAAIVGLTLLVVVPRRLVLLLPLLMLAGLAATSVVASNQVERLVAAEQANIVGTPADWIDHAADGNVTYVYDGEVYWNDVWQTRFWNRRVRDTLSIAPSRVPGPMAQTVASPQNDGGLPIHSRYVVATDVHTFVGTPVAHLAQPGLDVSGLTLWRLEGRPRLLEAISNIRPDGDIPGFATVVAYGCGGGHLELTLLPKDTKVLTLLLNGTVVRRVNIAGRKSWHGEIDVPPSRQAEICTFTIRGEGLLGSTVIQFVPG